MVAPLKYCHWYFCEVITVHFVINQTVNYDIHGYVWSMLSNTLSLISIYNQLLLQI
jgi:hypothetical protein